MFLKEVCQQCNVTKKALNYYESKGLLSPAVLDNGYRDYRHHDILQIKEILVLRQFGLSIADIKENLNCTNQSLILAKIKYLSTLQAQKLTVMQNNLDALMENYDIEAAFDQLQSNLMNHFTIKERMVLAFPGGYGLLLSLHFGRFLNDVIDTPKQRKAYQEIMDYLDAISLFITPELQDFLETTITSIKEINTEMLVANMQKEMTEMLEHTDDYLASRQDEITEYINFKQSDAFKTSPAGQMQEKLLEFQKKSGYREKFIENLKILSPSYQQYSIQLEQANHSFLQKFPEVDQFYS